MKSIKLAYLVSHPIQYQAPLLRRIAQEKDIDLTVFFCSDMSVREFFDQAFGTVIKWDVPLLEGYRHEFLPAFGGRGCVSFWRPLNFGLAWRLWKGNFDVLWIHGYHRWINWVAIALARALGIKTFIRDEAWTPVPAHKWKHHAKRLFFLVLGKGCDGFLSIGTLNRQYYQRYSINDAKIFSVPYAVDNGFFQRQTVEARPGCGTFRASLLLEAGRLVILFVGKLNAVKRPEDLLEAYIRLSPNGSSEPPPYLLFAGDGELRHELERRVAGLGWRSVKFLGFQSQRTLPALYSLCDVFVLPSSYEPWGLVVNEAMNAGKPVIVSDQVGCRLDLIREGENGLVFRAGDVQGLSVALRKVLGAPSERRRMGERSLEIINQFGFAEDLQGLRCAFGKVVPGFQG